MAITLDWKRLKSRCKASIRQSFNALKKQGGVIKGEVGDQYGYLDRGPDVKILAVAHLDWVEMGGFWFDVGNVKGEHWCACPTLDDRLGVYTILDVLPQFGIEVDVLLTENEECGRSTASEFFPKKDYNWIVEFDRRGTDVVTYNYTWDDVLKPYFDIGFGSYSDIADLDWLGVQAMNVGVGYHYEHTKYCFFVAEEWASQVKKFVKFYREHKDKVYPYDWNASQRFRGTTRVGFNSYYGFDRDSIHGLSDVETAADAAKIAYDWAKEEAQDNESFGIGANRSTKNGSGGKSSKKDEGGERPTEALSVHSIAREAQAGIHEAGEEGECKTCEPYGYPGWYLDYIEVKDELEKEVWIPCPTCNAEAQSLLEAWDKENTGELDT